MGWIATTNNPATTQVTFAGNSNIDVNPANETEVTLTAKWRYAKGLYSISNMQQMNPNICKANTTPNRTATTLDADGSHHGDPSYVPTKTLTDTRDNNTYTVSKLADGKCWMTQNLRIIDKTITPADSNVTANYTIPASSINGFSSYDTSNAYVDSDGGFYTWYAATAGTGTQSLSTRGQNTTASICPKGWRLPTGGDNGEFKALYSNYNSSSALRSNPVNFTLSGYVGGSSRLSQGSYGYYWSSTVRSSNYAYNLGLGTSGVLPADGNGKVYGLSVRCIADDKLGLSSIANMQDMTPEVCAATTTPLAAATQLDTDGSHHGDPNYVPTKTLTDTRDNNTYTVSKLADGKCWMTQNLRIGNMNINSTNSDVSSEHTVYPSHIDSTHGGYYSWHVATAGSGYGTSSRQNAAYSICPKGWRLPIGGSGNTNERWGLYSKYPSFAAMTSSPVNINLGGIYGTGLGDVGTRAIYWTATNYDNGGLDRADNLTLENGNVYYEPASYKGLGFSVRCVAR